MIIINEKEAERVIRQAQNTRKIISNIRAGYTPNEIVQRVGCNRSVVDYYIRLLNPRENNLATSAKAKSR